MALGGITGKGFLPGTSGNPGGRPKGLARLIREATDDGEKLRDYFLRVFQGEIFEYTSYDKNGVAHIAKHVPNLKERNEAGMWLADRGWGRPIPMPDEDEPETQDIMVKFIPSGTPVEELREMQRQCIAELREKLGPDFIRELMEAEASIAPRS